MSRNKEIHVPFKMYVFLRKTKSVFIMYKLVLKVSYFFQYRSTVFVFLSLYYMNNHIIAHCKANYKCLCSDLNILMPNLDLTA